MRIRIVPGGFVLLFTTLALAAGSVGIPGAASAQTAVASGNCPYWIDSATGERARTVPIGVSREELTNLQTDPYRDSCSWG
jgi:hypothetical protein